MKKLTIIFIPDKGKTSKQLTISSMLVKFAIFFSFCLSGFLGYLIFDYIELVSMRNTYDYLVAENEGLKGEARILMNNLEEVKGSLQRVQDYTTKLGKLTNLQVKKVSKKTGVKPIGPLSPEEYKIAQERQQKSSTNAYYMPLGLSMDKLAFKPVFDSLKTIGKQANSQALELQIILSSLSQQKSLLSSTPSMAPVNGWIASGFGYRISPFTGKRSMHKGVDIAAPIGTPIYAPADGVVIFSGKKEGFGNFIMIAHGYGVVTRYGHNSQNMVQPGERVHRGDQIGTVGMTGRTTGPHLHYEVVINGRNVNPMKFILDMSNTLSLL